MAAIVLRTGYRPQFRTLDTRQDAKQWARLIKSEIDPYSSIADQANG